MKTKMNNECKNKHNKFLFKNKMEKNTFGNLTTKIHECILNKLQHKIALIKNFHISFTQKDKYFIINY